MNTSIKFVQLVTGHWTGNNGDNFSLIGLVEDGTAWRYLAGEQRWEKYPSPRSWQNKVCGECGK